MHCSLKAALQVRRPSLVEPEVLPCCCRNEVSAPAVAKLVSDHVNIFAIATDKSRRCECVDWVFHPTVREASGKYKDVVPTPDIRRDEVFGYFDEVLGILL